MIGSLSTLGESRSTMWVNHNFYTYVVLREGTDPLVFEERLQEMVTKYVGPIITQFMGIDMEQFESAGHSYGYRLQKLTDIHLHSDLQYELEPNGNPLYVYIFLVAAILILVIAGINFMNLATARSTVRAREVGLRKVVGSSRRQLIAQFLTESVVLSILALIVAVILVYLLLPNYNNLIQLKLEFNPFGSGLWVSAFDFVCHTGRAGRGKLPGLCPCIIPTGCSVQLRQIVWFKEKLSEKRTHCIAIYGNHRDINRHHHRDQAVEFHAGQRPGIQKG